jgi:hypothetical protein
MAHMNQEPARSLRVLLNYLVGDLRVARIAERGEKLHDNIRDVSTPGR